MLSFFPLSFTWLHSSSCGQVSCCMGSKKKKKKETQSLVMAEHGVVALKLSRLSRFDWSGVVVCAFVHFL